VRNGDVKGLEKKSLNWKCELLEPLFETGCKKADLPKVRLAHDPK
jgi:hypothetical protein